MLEFYLMFSRYLIRLRMYVVMFKEQIEKKDFAEQ